ISQNFRILILPVTAAALIIGSLAVAILWNLIVGLIFLIASAYISYYLLKFFRYSTQSVIRITDVGISGIASDGNKYSFQWEMLSLAGEFSIRGKGKEVFLYSDEDDQLIRIPSLYSNPEELSREIEEHSGEFARWEGLNPGDLETQLLKRFTS
ncbi:MAG: hypothetical protein KAH21_11770, partial [Spirochaetaceae bacterium]|nr:hypothetical protein [Spirochaetaceae bacterium]